MFLILSVLGAVVLCVLFVTRIKRKRDRNELELNSITPEALHTLMASNQGILVFDVRQPLDLLGHSTIIPAQSGFRQRKCSRIHRSSRKRRTR